MTPSAHCQAAQISKRRRPPRRPSRSVAPAHTVLSWPKAGRRPEPGKQDLPARRGGQADVLVGPEGTIDVGTNSVEAINVNSP